MKERVIKEQSLTQGAAVLLLSTVLVKLIGAFFKIPLSSDICLGDLGFGYFSFAYDIYTPVYTLALSGIPVAISKIISGFSLSEKADEADTALKIFKRVLLISGIAGFLLILILTKPLVFVTDKTGKTAYSMLAMAPAVIFCCLSSVYRGYYEGCRNMTPTAVSNVIEALSKVLLGLTAAFVTVKLTGNAALGAAAAMAGISAGTVLSYLYLRFSFSKTYKFAGKKSVKTDKTLIKKLIIISLPIVFSSFAGSIVSFIDAVTVKWQLSGMMTDSFGTIAQMYQSTLSGDTLPTFLYGIRSKAFTLFNLIPTFTVSLGISALPIISAAFVKGHRAEVEKSINSVLKFSSVVAFPLAFGFMFVGTPIMSLLFGDTTAAIGGKMLCIYGIAALSAGLTMPLTAVLQALSKQNRAFLNFSVGLVIKLAVNIIFTAFPNINIFGAVVGTAACYVFVMFAHLVTLFKTGYKLQIKNTLFKPFSAAFACGVTALLICRISVSGIVTVAAIGAAAVVYLAVLIATKTFDRSDFTDFPLGKKLSKLIK